MVTVSQGARLSVIWLGVALSVGACATTRFHERERVADRAARFDQDAALGYILGKLHAAREGAFGAFGAAAAGGCGCQ